ncbi:MAG: hypothetical protein IJG36_03760, partial [Synergistaceae bacterium]|nr:hypothetical protein [Synergistaceae bacterium]
TNHKKEEILMCVKKFLLVLMLLCVSVKAEAASFRDELLKLEGVVSVDVIVQSPDKSGDIAFNEKYIAWFEQPLDWDNPSGGKFLQRAEIGFQGMDSVNVMYVGGYELYDSNFPKDDRVELAKMYSANFISIEYRYFGESMPAGLSDDVPALWEHLTNKNAAADFHNIMEKLRGILSGNWVFTGVSKGGYTTNVFAYYYPNDADAYVPYVAPLCEGTEDPRLPEAVYTVIGNERYGAVQAKVYRDLMMKYLVEMIRERHYIQPRYYKLISDDIPVGSEDFYISPDAMPSYDISYEAELLYLPVEVWQYDKGFDSFDAVLKMPKDTSRDRELYLRSMLELLRRVDDDGDMEEKKVNKATGVGVIYAYYVQVMKENGSYCKMFKYFREALAKEGLTLKFKEEDEPGYDARTQVKPHLLASLSFDRTLNDNIREWSHTTESNVMMIYGTSDPWYFMRMPDVTDNPNVHIFTAQYGHGAEISMLASDDKAAATKLLDTWLQSDSDTDTDPQEIRVLPSSSGNCNFSGMGALMLSAMFVLIRRKK